MFQASLQVLEIPLILQFPLDQDCHSVHSDLADQSVLENQHFLWDLQHQVSQRNHWDLDYPYLLDYHLDQDFQHFLAHQRILALQPIPLDHSDL